MPKIYLSPSTQEYNPYVTGAGSEEYFMNLLADAMEPILLLNGIQFSRNTPDMTAASSIRQAAMVSRNSKSQWDLTISGSHLCTSR